MYWQSSGENKDFGDTRLKTFFEITGRSFTHWIKADKGFEPSRGDIAFTGTGALVGEGRCTIRGGFYTSADFEQDVFLDCFIEEPNAFLSSATGFASKTMKRVLGRIVKRYQRHKDKHDSESYESYDAYADGRVYDDYSEDSKP